MNFNEVYQLLMTSENKRNSRKLDIIYSMRGGFKGEVNPKIKFVLFERTFKITE